MMKRNYLIFTLLSLVLFSGFTVLLNESKKEGSISSNTKGEADRDFVSFENKRNIAFNETKNNKDTSTKSKEIQTTVKATLVGSVQPLPLYGFNGEMKNSPPFSNKPFLDSIATLPFKIIRYPGGGNSSWWDWRKGRMVNESETPTELPSGIKKWKSKYDDAPHDLNDLKLLIDKTESEVVFVLNMVTKDLDDQLLMLQTAQSLGIPVKWVELGNEFYLAKSPGKQKFFTPANYGRNAEQWILAIKKQFKNAKVAVIGSTGADDWNEEVLKNTPDADAIVAHIYPSSINVADASGINFSELYNRVKTKFNKFQKKQVPIWVTEYNIQWGKGEGKNNLKQYSMTWSQTLATVLMTSTITSFGDIEIALNQSVPGDVIKLATLTKKPNGIGMQVWLSACKDKNQMQKIDLGMQDYELMGWKFVNNTTKKQSYILTNYTQNNISLDLSALLSGNELYQIEYADKNAVINGWQDVLKQNGQVQNKLLTVPPYSITIIQ
ncbi:MAG: hypothetical protein ACTHJ5_06985 [Ilyomonas sp.]